jgi:hypothetical protein
VVVRHSPLHAGIDVRQSRDCTRNQTVGTARSNGSVGAVADHSLYCLLAFQERSTQCWTGSAVIVSVTRTVTG